MATLLFVLLWWMALFGWWLVLVGTSARLELLAAACAALLGALFAAALRSRGLLEFRFERRWLAKTLKVPWKIVRELGVIFWALALHLAGVRHLSGFYRAFPFPTGRNDPASAGRRAVAAEADALSPNTLPVDMDCERGLALRHELDPRHTSNDLP
jgi:ABC-type amino acid transport system permease subunit